MSSPVSAVEAIEKAMREAAVNLVYTLVLERETNGQSKEFSDWAVFMTVRAFIEQRAIGARAPEALAERLKLEAHAHAMEARTANSTIHEIYQVVSSGKGEPGSWHGAEPVRAKLEALKRENAELQEALRPFVTDWADDSGWTDVACQKDRIVDWFGPSDFRRARTLLKEEANAE